MFLRTLREPWLFYIWPVFSLILKGAWKSTQIFVRSIFLYKILNVCEVFTILLGKLSFWLALYHYITISNKIRFSFWSSTLTVWAEWAETKKRKLRLFSFIFINKFKYSLTFLETTVWFTYSHIYYPLSSFLFLCNALPRKRLPLLMDKSCCFVALDVGNI